MPITSRPIELPGYVQGVCGSSAFLDVSATTVKNLPYIFFAQELNINTLLHSITSKISYGESLLRSSASAVYNFAIGTVFVGAALVTFGKSSAINTAAQKYWIYTGLALASAGVALLGVISARVGMAANAVLLHAAKNYVMQSAEKDLVRLVKTVFQEHKRKLIASLPSHFDLKPLEAKIMRASKLKDLFGLIETAIHQANRNALTFDDVT